MCFDKVAVFNHRAKFKLNSYPNRWISLGTGGLKVEADSLCSCMFISLALQAPTLKSGCLHHLQVSDCFYLFILSFVESPQTCVRHRERTV